MRFKELLEDQERIRNLTNKMAGLPASINARYLDQIERVLKIAHRTDKRGGTSQTGTIANTLSKIDDEDLQRGKYYRSVAKEMVGHELNPQEIGAIVRAMKSDKAVNFNELRSVSSDISKIFPQFAMSENTKAFYQDLFFVVPQRVGPGEVLFCIMSKSIYKGGKGDLTIKSEDGEEGVEVKAGKTGGRFRDADVKKAQSSNLRQLQKQFLDKYPKPISSGWSIDAIVKGLMNQENIDPGQVANEAIAIFNAVFPGNSYSTKLKNAMLGGNLTEVRQFYALASLETYYKAKGEKAQAYLFINAKSMPAKTCYVNSYQDIVSGINKALKFSEISIPYLVDDSGGDEEYPKITLSAL